MPKGMHEIVHRRASDPQIDRIEKVLIGNGQEGLIPRTARMEENLISLKESVKTVSDAATAANEIAVGTGEQALRKFEEIALTLNNMNNSFSNLATSVNEHHKSKHFSDYLKNPKFYAAIFVGFIILHLVSTYFPNIWDWLALFLGVPKLVIPIT